MDTKHTAYEYAKDPDKYFEAVQDWLADFDSCHEMWETAPEDLIDFGSYQYCRSQPGHQNDARRVKRESRRLLIDLEASEQLNDRIPALSAYLARVVKQIGHATRDAEAQLRVERLDFEKTVTDAMRWYHSPSNQWLGVRKTPHWQASFQVGKSAFNDEVARLVKEGLVRRGENRSGIDLSLQAFQILSDRWPKLTLSQAIELPEPTVSFAKSAESSK